MQSAFDRAGLVADTVGDFRDGELFKVPQQHDFQIVCRQRFKRTRKVNSQSLIGAADELLLRHFVLQWLMFEHPLMQGGRCASLRETSRPGGSSFNPVLRSTAS